MCDADNSAYLEVVSMSMSTIDKLNNQIGNAQEAIFSMQAELNQKTADLERLEISRSPNCILQAEIDQ